MSGFSHSRKAFQGSGRSPSAHDKNVAQASSLFQLTINRQDACSSFNGRSEIARYPTLNNAGKFDPSPFTRESTINI